MKRSRTYEAAWREEILSPLRPSTADELRWYFEQRRRVEDAASGLPDNQDFAV